MPRIFELVRHADVSGVSGTGVVAEGCVFTDGSVALRWRGDNPATAVWPDLDSVLAVHGHHGATEVNWLDQLDRSAFRAPMLPYPATPPGGARSPLVPTPPDPADTVEWSEPLQASIPPASAFADSSPFADAPSPFADLPDPFDERGSSVPPSPFIEPGLSVPGSPFAESEVPGEGRQPGGRYRREPVVDGHHGDEAWGDLLDGRTSHGYRPSTPAGSFLGESAPRSRGRHFRS
ncbi:hypothetical protein [Kribbella deserti]|uniref:Uncharacterized protein n=1 Tax=Kribbella deserti TaxID=1926257 RepID=A0ABV6QUK2_9ACTN